jgi:CO/xanthine dehydrogenase FAD-binding subunit
VRAVEAEKIINSGRSLEQAGAAAAEELTFGDNTRGSAAYRKALCKTLVKRAIEGVIHAI